ncbi:hypothetical protein HDV03_003773 [Kappamyces sp. JEL0829]|nr:hypothetical protein HDV03_003773 [Kappamyces sp. JEL0829]
MFHILKAGLKAPPNGLSSITTNVRRDRSNSSISSARPPLSSISSGSLPLEGVLGTALEENTDLRDRDGSSQPAAPATSFADKANKRKSRLGTTQYLAPKIEISESDRRLVFRSGSVVWSSPCKRPIGTKSVDGGEQVYVQIIDGSARVFAEEPRSEAPPVFSVSLANALPFLNETKFTLKVMLLEDEEVHNFKFADLDRAKEWTDTINEVSYRWGLVQKSEMEHEIASMRKQLGQLWELCTDATVPPKIQKRINDLTVEMQMKDSLMADVIARQGTTSMLTVDELSVKQIQKRKKDRKVDLFPSEMETNEEVPSDRDDCDVQDQDKDSDDRDKNDSDDRDENDGKDDSEELYENDSQDLVAPIDITVTADEDDALSRASSDHALFLTHITEKTVEEVFYIRKKSIDPSLGQMTPPMQKKKSIIEDLDFLEAAIKTRFTDAKEGQDTKPGSDGTRSNRVSLSVSKELNSAARPSILQQRLNNGVEMANTTASSNNLESVVSPQPQVTLSSERLSDAAAREAVPAAEMALASPRAEIMSAADELLAAPPSQPEVNVPEPDDQAHMQQSDGVFQDPCVSAVQNILDIPAETSSQVTTVQEPMSPKVEVGSDASSNGALAEETPAPTQLPLAEHSNAASRKTSRSNIPEVSVTNTEALRAKLSSHSIYQEQNSTPLENCIMDVVRKSNENVSMAEHTTSQKVLGFAQIDTNTWKPSTAFQSIKDKDKYRLPHASSQDLYDSSTNLSSTRLQRDNSIENLSDSKTKSAEDLMLLFGQLGVATNTASRNLPLPVEPANPPTTTRTTIPVAVAPSSSLSSLSKNDAPSRQNVSVLSSSTARLENTGSGQRNGAEPRETLLRTASDFGTAKAPAEEKASSLTALHTTPAVIKIAAPVLNGTAPVLSREKLAPTLPAKAPASVAGVAPVLKVHATVHSGAAPILPKSAPVLPATQAPVLPAKAPVLPTSQTQAPVLKKVVIPIAVSLALKPKAAGTALAAKEEVQTPISPAVDAHVDQTPKPAAPVLNIKLKETPSMPSLAPSMPGRLGTAPVIKKIILPEGSKVAIAKLSAEASSEETIPRSSVSDKIESAPIPKPLAPVLGKSAPVLKKK